MNSNLNIDIQINLSSKNSKKNWIIPANIETYDVFSAFQKYNRIDWHQSVNYEVGDCIYIYCSKPYQRIMFLVRVIKINIPFEETIDDNEFWAKDIKALPKRNKYVRIELIQEMDTDSLQLKHLINKGLKKAPQGPLKISGVLQQYIETIINKDSTESLITEELSPNKTETFFEGAKRQITINAYERNPLARKKCIEIHGSKCMICDFNFGAFYGEEFKGKIHVHHTKPLHLIDETYEVNPECDLVPVCPNCHMILHSKSNDTYTIEEVKQMIEGLG